MRVLILTEGTYPYYRGGVSTWIHNLIKGLQDVDFYILSLVTNPFVKPLYNLPPNVKELITVPLWGTIWVEEYSSFPRGRLIKRRPIRGSASVKDLFVPYFQELLFEMIKGNPSYKKMSEYLYGLWSFLREYDYRRAFRERKLWSAIIQLVKEDPLYSAMSLRSFLRILEAIKRMMLILTVEMPEVDVLHSSVASLSGLPAIIEKMDKGCPYLITEHGVYYRERLLELMRRSEDLASKTLWVNIYKSIVGLNYYHADKVLPVCRFNARWEGLFGVSAEKVEVIYNGVDVERFKPLEGLEEEKLIVVVSRIEKLKDTLNLIEALRFVLEEDGEVRCEVYGPIVDKTYYELCLRRIKELGIEDAISFMGPTPRPEIEYNRATLVVLPSLSEGFPYSVIEAMACGKLVIATSVGGVPEALRGCGILVPPRSPRLLADAILKGLRDERLRRELGARARRRVLRLFTKERFLEDYRRVYVEALSNLKFDTPPL